MVTVRKDRSWCDGAPFVLLAVAGAFGLYFGFSMPKPYENENIAGALVVLVSLLALLASLVWTLQTRCERTRKVSGKQRALALVDEKSGTVLQAGLQKVLLKPWPFQNPYTVVEYPLWFSFSTILSPVTVNPKIVPLETKVQVALAPHNDLPNWFASFVQNQAVLEQEFKRQMFETLHHQLPQELANQLNPFDQDTVRRVVDFVQSRITGPQFNASCMTMQLGMRNN